MLKKILIIVGLFMISALAYLFFGTMNLQTEFKNLIIDYVEDGDYEKAYGFHNTIYNEDLAYEETKDGLVVQIYNAISTIELPLEESEDDTEVTTYSIFDKTLDISIFHVSGRLNTSDDCVVEITFDGIETPFTKELEKGGYELSVAGNFDFIPVSIFEYEVLYELNLETLPNVTNIKFIDGKEETKVNIEKTFDAYPDSFYAPSQSFLDDYEYYVSGEFEEFLESQEFTEEEIKEKKTDEETRLSELLETILDDENFKTNNFEQSHITSRTSYIVKNVVLIVSIIILNGVVVYFALIKKKKSHTMPIVKMPVNK